MDLTDLIHCSSISGTSLEIESQYIIPQQSMEQSKLLSTSPTKYTPHETLLYDNSLYSSQMDENNWLDTSTTPSTFLSQPCLTFNPMTLTSTTLDTTNDDNTNTVTSIGTAATTITEGHSADNSSISVSSESSNNHSSFSVPSNPSTTMALQPHQNDKNTNSTTASPLEDPFYVSKSFYSNSTPLVNPIRTHDSNNSNNNNNNNNNNNSNNSNNINQRGLLDNTFLTSSFASTTSTSSISSLQSQSQPQPQNDTYTISNDSATFIFETPMITPSSSSSQLKENEKLMKEKPLSIQKEQQQQQSRFISQQLTINGENVSSENIEDGYIQFILHHDPKYIGEGIDNLVFARRKFSSVPKASDLSYTTWDVFILVKKLHNQQIKNWSQLVGQLGLSDMMGRPQFAQRVKRWMHKYKIDLYFDYLLGTPFDFHASEEKYSGCLLMGNYQKKKEDQHHDSTTTTTTVAAKDSTHRKKRYQEIEDMNDLQNDRPMLMAGSRKRMRNKPQPNLILLNSRHDGSDEDIDIDSDGYDHDMDNDLGNGENDTPNQKYVNTMNSGTGTGDMHKGTRFTLMNNKNYTNINIENNANSYEDEEEVEYEEGDDGVDISDYRKKVNKNNYDHGDDISSNHTNTDDDIEDSGNIESPVAYSERDEEIQSDNDLYNERLPRKQAKRQKPYSTQKFDKDMAYEEEDDELAPTSSTSSSPKFLPLDNNIYQNEHSSHSLPPLTTINNTPSTTSKSTSIATAGPPANYKYNTNNNNDNNNKDNANDNDNDKDNDKNSNNRNIQHCHSSQLENNTISDNNSSMNNYKLCTSCEQLSSTVRDLQAQTVELKSQMLKWESQLASLQQQVSSVTKEKEKMHEQYYLWKKKLTQHLLSDPFTLNNEDKHS